MVYTQLMCTKEIHTAVSVLPENTETTVLLKTSV